MFRLLFLLICFPFHALYAAPSGDEKRVELKITCRFAVQGFVNKLRIKMQVPTDIRDRQYVEEAHFSTEPDSFYRSGGNAYVLFKLTNIDRDFKLTFTCRVRIYRRIALHRDTAGAATLASFLMEEPNIEVNAETIRSKANSLRQKTDIETVLRTFEFVKQHISYKRNEAVGAGKVLELGVGKCMDYSDLFVALLRANGIPARSVFGYVAFTNHENPLHAWPEVYLQRQGWVRFDPTAGHSEIVPDGANYKMRIANKYITLWEGRNDPGMRAAFINYRWQGDTGGKVTLRVSFEDRELQPE